MGESPHYVPEELLEEENMTPTSAIMAGVTVLTALAHASAADAAPRSPHTWGRWEQRLTSDKTYATPCADVNVQVTYHGPGGRTLNGYGFWDGGSTYVIRCAFPAPGRWTWETHCSDPTNKGLDGQAGEVRVTPYHGANPLYRHGFLRVSDNHRYLCYADGTPFLWLGDTAWAAPLLATDADWATYLDNRVRKRFSVIQVAIAPWWAGKVDAKGVQPFTGEGITHPTPAFWRDYDAKIQAANEKGLALLIVGVMEPTTRYPEADEARQFAHYLASRLFGNFVIYSPSFDSPYMELANTVGEALRQTTSVQLITEHPGTPSGRPINPWATAYHTQPYLDFSGDQSGHNGGNRELCARQAIEWNLGLWNLTPTKPVIHLEAMYDAHGVTGWTASDARSLGWRGWLSGALGYTYGAGDIPPKVPGMHGGIYHWDDNPVDEDYWRKAMDWKSSDQMTLMRDFFASVQWWRLQPAFGQVENQPADWTLKMPFAKTPNGDLAAAYLPDNDGIDISMSGFAAPVAARWFDPVHGGYQAIPGAIQPGGAHHFQAPARGEWVLELQKAP